MRKRLFAIRRFVWLIALLFATIGVTGLLTYWAGQQGLRTAFQYPAGTPIVIAPRPDDLGTPSIGQVALAPLMQAAADLSAYGSTGLEFSQAISIGMYLPRSGNTQFALAAPTAPPTPLPYPTSPPLPLPALAPLPTAAADSGSAADAVAANLYGGDGCAPSELPVAGILTQRYHFYHSGIDLGVPIGTPVIATHSGIVTFADWSVVGYGYLVIVQNGRFITYYAHNNAFNVSTGMTIGKGTVLAWSGSTGNSTGPHVHYETRVDDIPVDPLTFESLGFPSC